MDKIHDNKFNLQDLMEDPWYRTGDIFFRWYNYPPILGRE